MYLLSSYARVSELSLQSHGGAGKAMQLVGFNATRATGTERLRRAPPYSWARGCPCNLGKPSPLPRAGPTLSPQRQSPCHPLFLKHRVVCCRNQSVLLRDVSAHPGDCFISVYVDLPHSFSPLGPPLPPPSTLGFL